MATAVVIFLIIGYSRKFCHCQFSSTTIQLFVKILCVSSIVFKFLVFSVLFFKLTTSSECNIDPIKIKPTPLVTNKNNFVYPSSGNSEASIRELDSISICCPGNQLMHNGNTVGDNCASLTCGEDSQFYWQDQNVDFYSFYCQNIPKDTIRYTQKQCPEGGQEIEIGYDLGDNKFIRQIKICFDNDKLSPVYSYYNLTKNIGYRDSKVPRIFFKEDGFYTVSTDLDRLYTRNQERQIVNYQLGLNNNSETYIKTNGELFINRGHLTAKGDFVYGFQQLATFHYVNSAPQWATFNGGNWNELEISARDLAHFRGIDLEVYTGVHGTSLLPNKDTERLNELYLHKENGRNVLPVSQLFWKVIYRRETAEGIAVIGINNPYYINKRDDVICQDVSNKVTWFNSKLKRQKENIELGYTYACSVQDFRKVVKTFPQLNITSLLL